MTAMKKYGIILADNGSDWYITGESNDAWVPYMDQISSDMPRFMAATSRLSTRAPCRPPASDAAADSDRGAPRRLRQRHLACGRGVAGAAAWPAAVLRAAAERRRPRDAAARVAWAARPGLASAVDWVARRAPRARTRTAALAGRPAPRRCAGAVGPACGERGQACCPGAMCSARATCDGTACIASDVWASELDGTFEFTGATWTQPLVSGTSQSLPAMNGCGAPRRRSSSVPGTRDSVPEHRHGLAQADRRQSERQLLRRRGVRSSDVWAVGDIDFAHWNGATWTTSAAPSGANGNPFYAVWLSGPGAGWAVGEQAVYAQLSAGAWTFIGHSSNGYAYHGVWGAPRRTCTSSATAIRSRASATRCSSSTTTAPRGPTSAAPSIRAAA